VFDLLLEGVFEHEQRADGQCDADVQDHRVEELAGAAAEPAAHLVLVALELFDGDQRPDEHLLEAPELQVEYGGHVHAPVVEQLVHGEQVVHFVLLSVLLGDAARNRLLSLLVQLVCDGEGELDLVGLDFHVCN